MQSPRAHTSAFAHRQDCSVPVLKGELSLLREFPGFPFLKKAQVFVFLSNSQKTQLQLSVTIHVRLYFKCSLFVSRHKLKLPSG